MIKIEWEHIILIVTVLVLALMEINAIGKKMKLKPETKRKIFHICMGLTVLTFPYIFTSGLSVVVLLILAIGFLLTLKYTNLKHTLGKPLYDVNRKSSGEIYFTVAVFLIYFLSKGNPILYCVPILVLTFADSVAAIIGKNYAKKTISQQNEDAKSIEGSFMFFIVAFLLVLIPLLLFTNVGRAETLLIAAIVGLNVSMIEMISHSGNDNLLIPLTTYAFLSSLIGQSINTLCMNITVLIVIFALVTVINRIKSWSKMAVIEFVVAGYLTVLLYGFYAIFPPLMLLLTVMTYPSKRSSEVNNIYDARIIETNVTIGIAISAIAAILHLKEHLFMIYALVYAMHLTINSYVRFKYYLNLTDDNSLIYAFIKGLCFILIPSVAIQKIVFGAYPTPQLLIAMSIALFASGVFILIYKKDQKKEVISIENGYVHMKIVMFLAIVVETLHYFSIV